jgi:hypothetical protein
VSAPNVIWEPLEWLSYILARARPREHSPRMGIWIFLWQDEMMLSR